MTFAPKSSHIQNVEYDPASQIISVQFANGKTYTHGGFPADAAAAFQKFPSAGSYYHRFVKKYKLLEVKDAEPKK